MPHEIKSDRTGGKKVESWVSPASKKKFIQYCKKANISQAQVIRDHIQALTKTVRVRK